MLLFVIDSRDHRYEDNGRDRFDERRSGRLSPGYDLQRSRSPYHTSNQSRSYYSRSTSRSPERPTSMRSPPTEPASNRRDYYDRDAPGNNNGGNYGGQPSRDVILEGIHSTMNDDDVATLTLISPYAHAFFAFYFTFTE